jgi:DNA-binding LytR/AlgR family response regulator
VAALLAGGSNDVHAAAQPAMPRVMTHHHGAWSFHDARMVSRFYAADKYTCFMQGDKEQLITESLNSLERRLQAHGFLRVHRGELVNLAHVARVIRTGGTVSVSLRDGQVVQVSRRQMPTLRRHLQF